MAAEPPTAIFRADASEEIGGGHVMRCLTLAEALTEQGWHVGFAVNAEAPSVVPSLADAVADILILGGGDEVAALKERWPEGVALLVVDHYGRGAAFELGCRPWAATIVAIDDLADRCHRADLLLDQTQGRNEADYRSLTCPDCRLLLGARFALLRPQFQACRRRALARRGSDGPAQRLLVSFGATDSAGGTVMALQALARASPALTVDVVVGASGNLNEIDRLAAELAPAATVHRSVGDMASLMTEADFAIGAAGGTSWERCCLGLPTLVVVTADNQRDIARSLAAAGAIDLVGDAGTVAVEALADRIAALCDDAPRRHTMAQAAASICDGQGVARVVDALMQATLQTVPMARHGHNAIPRWDGQTAARSGQQSQP